MRASFRKLFKALLIGASFLLSPGCGVIPIGVLEGQPSTIQDNPFAPSNLPAVKLSWSGLNSMVAGQCSLYTVVGVDQNGAPSAPFPANTVLNLSGSGSETQSGLFSTTALGSSPVTSVSISSSNNAIIYFCGYTARPFTLTAITSGSSVTAPVAGTYQLLVNPGPPAKAMVTGPASIGQNVCSQYTLTVKDTFDNVTAFSTNQLFTLSFEVPNGFASDATNGVTAYSSANCSGNSSTSLTPMAGSLYQNFYLYPESVGEFIVDAHANGLSQDGQETVAVLPGSALKMLFSVPLNNVLAGNCYHGTLQTVDPVTSVPHPISNATIVTLAPPNSNFRIFSSQSDCQNSSSSKRTFPMAAGTGSLDFYFTDTKAEQATVHASASPAILQAASFTENFSGNLPMTAITAVGNNLTSVPSNSCTSATISLRDHYGNVPSLLAAPYTLPLKLTGANNTQVMAYSGQGCIGSPITAAQFSSSSTFDYSFKAILATSVSSSSVNLDVVEPATWDPSSSAELKITTAIGVPDHLLIIPISGQTALTAGQCYRFRIAAFDNVNNPILQSSDLALTLSEIQPDPRGGWYLDSDSQCSSTSSLAQSKIPKGTSSIVLRYRTNSGSYQGKLEAIANVTAVLPIRSIPAIASKLSLSMQSQASFNQCVPATVTVMDAFDNPVGVSGGVNISLSGGVGSHSFPFYPSVLACSGSSSSTLQLADNQSQGTIYFGAVASGQATITAEEAAVQTNSNIPALSLASQTIQIGAANANKLILGPSNGSLTAGSCIGVQLEMTDSNNQPLANMLSTPVTITSSPALQLYSDNCVTALNNSILTLDPSENPRTVYLKDVHSETVILNATGGGLTAVPFSFAIGAGPLDSILISGPVDSNNNPIPVFAGIATPGFKATLVDSYLNPVSATLSVQMGTSPFNGTPVLSADCQSTFSNGSLTFSRQASAPFCILAPSAGTLQITATSSEVPKGGSASFTIFANTVAFAVPLLNFGNVTIDNSVTRTYSFQNSASAPTSILVTGAPQIANDSSPNSATNSPSSFAILSNDCPAPPFKLDPGRGCNLSLKFTPSSVGLKTASIIVTTEAGSVTGALQGTGLTAANLSVSPTAANPLDFGAVIEGTVTGSKDIIVQNSGGTAATFSSINLSDSNNFSFVDPHSYSGSCAINGVAGAGTCIIRIVASPKASASFQSAVTIQAVSPQVTLTTSTKVTGITPANLLLSGNGTNFGIVLQNTDGSNSHFSAPYCMQVTNVGQATATLGGSGFVLFNGINFANTSAVSDCVSGGPAPKSCSAGMQLGSNDSCYLKFYGHPVQVGTNLYDDFGISYTNGVVGTVSNLARFYVTGDGQMMPSGGGTVAPNPTIAVDVYGQPYGLSTPFNLTCESADHRPAHYNGTVAVWPPSAAGLVGGTPLSDGATVTAQANTDYDKVGNIAIAFGITSDANPNNSTVCNYYVHVNGIATPAPNGGAISAVPGAVPQGAFYNVVSANYVQAMTDQPLTLYFSAQNASQCRLTPDDSQAWYSYQVGHPPSPIPSNLIYWGAQNGENWSGSPSGSAVLPINTGSAVRDTVFRLMCQGKGVVSEVEVADFRIQRIGYAAGGPLMASTLASNYADSLWCGRLIENGWHREPGTDLSACATNARIGYRFANGRAVGFSLNAQGEPQGNNFTGHANCVCVNPNGVNNGENWISSSRP